MESTEGLLDKAKKLREALEAEPTQADIEDRRAANPQEHDDILAHIEKIASQNRIQVSPSLFKLTPRHSGRALPIIVNLGAIVLVTAVLSLLYILFNSGQASAIEEGVTLQSAEGKLLAEIKKQSEAELAEKDRQLKEIEGQLSKVQDERNTLATNLEDKVKQREVSIKAQMEALLEAERRKLREQGFSEAEIERRVKEFERKKSEEFNQQLASYRKQLETEKAKAEAELNRMEEQYASQISKVNKDRENLLSESKAREEELRKQLVAAQQAGSSQSTEAQEKARQAQAQIDRINQIREQERSIDQQIGGFYGTIRDQLNGKRWTEAEASLNSLATYLRSPAMASSDSLIQKRDKELYNVEVLRRYLESERSAPNTSELVKNASIVTEAESLKSKALAEIKAGNRGAAAQTWTQLLRSIPGGAEAMAFRDEESKTATDAALAKTSAEFQAQLQALRDQYAAAQNEEAAAKLEELTKTLGTTTEELTLAKTSLKDTEKQLKEMEKQLKKSDQELKDEKKRGLDNLANYTKTNATLTARTAALDLENLGLRSTVESREAEIKRLQDEITTLKASVSTGTSGGVDQARLNQEKIAALETEIAALKTENKTLLNRPADNSVELAKIKSLEESLAKVKLVEAEYNALLKAFDTYQNNLKGISTNNADQRVKDQKRLLDTFLSGPEARKALPGLATAIGTYEKALVDSGKPAGYLDATTVVWEVINIRDKATRESHLRNLVGRETNEARKDFLNSLINIIR